VIEREADVAIVGSGAGGGTVAQALAPLVRQGRRVLVLEKGPRLRDEEFTGRELEMASALYEDGGGFLTADGTLTLALGTGYGGSTVVYTGTSLEAPERVIRRWSVLGLEHADVARRTCIFKEEVNAHLLPPEEINENNRLFLAGCQAAGFEAEAFPVNVRGCRGSGLCNLGCPNAAKMGTNRVQLPNAERQGVEVVTRAEVLAVEERALRVRVREARPGEKGLGSEWTPGEYRVRARAIVLAAGAVGTPALLLRSPVGAGLPRLGRGFTCHPALILAAEHARPVENDVGHPKSYYVDRAEQEGYLLESCHYFPFVTAKSLVGFGPDHSRMMRAFPRLQMILVLVPDHARDGHRVGVSGEGRPVVHYRLTPGVIEALVRGIRAASRVFFGAGAVRVHAPAADPPLVEASESGSLEARIDASHFRLGKVSVSAAHPMGGCAMGRGPADSVTDAWGRVHGRPWLRVADASLFPDSVEVNPYLTIMALADRVAEALGDDLPGL
jgi:choline dehydrogenase-like flavoprotein